MSLALGALVLYGMQIAMKAGLGQLDREKRRQMKELLTKLENIANYNHDPAVHARLQTDIGIAGLRLLGDIAKDVREIARFTANDKTEVNTEIIAKDIGQLLVSLEKGHNDPTWEEIVRLLRKIAGEPEPSAADPATDAPLWPDDYGWDEEGIAAWNSHNVPGTKFRVAGGYVVIEEPAVLANAAPPWMARVMVRWTDSRGILGGSFDVSLSAFLERVVVEEG